LPTAQAAANHENQGWLVAEVTRGAPLRWGDAFVLAKASWFGYPPRGGWACAVAVPSFGPCRTSPGGTHSL